MLRLPRREEEGDVETIDGDHGGRGAGHGHVPDFRILVGDVGGDIYPPLLVLGEPRGANGPDDGRVVPLLHPDL